MSEALKALEIINIKLKDKNNKYDRRVVNGCDEYLYLIKEEELKIIETALKREDSIEITAIDIEQDNKELCKENKKLKRALEIFKENLVVSCDESENDMPCLVLGFKVDKDKMAIIYHTFDKEKIDLLKEVLL